MKSIKIKSDKKIKAYIIVALFLTIAYQFLVFGRLDTVIDTAITTLWPIIISAIAVYVFYKIVSEMECIIWFDQMQMKVGSLFPKTIRYSDIKNVFIKNGINISLKNGSCYKLPVVNPKENREKYIEIIGCIAEESGLKLVAGHQVDMLIKNQKASYKEPFGEALKYLDAYLKVILFGSIGSLYSMLVENLRGGDPIRTVAVIAFGVLFIMNILVSYLFVTRYKDSKQIVIIFMAVRFCILRLIVNPPNWVYAISENAEFNLSANIIWMLLLVLAIIFICMINRHFKTSELAQNTFINDRLFKKAYPEQEFFKINKRQKIVLIVSGVLIGAVIIFGVVLIIISEIRTDKNYYDSREQIIGEKYKKADGVYMEQGEYAYIITDGEGWDLVHRNTDNKYIYFNSWHEETKDAKRYYESDDIEYERFFSSVFGWLHNDYYILIIHRYLYSTGNKDVVFYDELGQWEPFEAYGDIYYMKVIKADLIDDDYKIMVDIGNKTYTLMTLRELLADE